MHPGRGRPDVPAYAGVGERLRSAGATQGLEPKEGRKSHGMRAGADDCGATDTYRQLLRKPPVRPPYVGERGLSSFFPDTCGMTGHGDGCGPPTPRLPPTPVFLGSPTGLVEACPSAMPRLRYNSLKTLASIP